MPILHQQTRMASLVTLCAVILMSGGVWADSKQGANTGLGINFIETTATNNKNVISKGSATGTGGYVGYRFDLAKRSMFIDIEVNYWRFPYSQPLSLAEAMYIYP